VTSYLARALEAEACGQWLESHLLCERALTAAPEDPGALNLLGRLCGVAGDWGRALALQSFVLHLAPEHAAAKEDLAAARRTIRSPVEARRLFERAVGAEPDLTCHHRYWRSLLPFAGMERAEELLRSSLALDPSQAGVHAALGNLLARRRRYVDAANAYALAVMLRWDFAEAHLILADLLDAREEEAMARRHRREALDVRQLYPACACSDGAVRRVLVLAALGGAIENAPLDLVVDPARTALHRLYLIDAAKVPGELPAHDVIFNGLEELESSAGAIALAVEFVRAAPVRVVNDPGHLGRIRRSRLRASLSGIAGCEVLATIRASRDELAGVPDGPGVLGTPFPIVIRPIDRHGGKGCECLSSTGELRAYLAARSEDRYDVAPFVDYRSGDGYFRKYRVVVVGGEPFPYHLAISDRWMVHYAGSRMEEFAWMRCEEERFLADPAAVFERWSEIFKAIAGALGLDYFGVDCARMQDGTLLVFECGTSMLVHCQDDPELFGYKYRYVPRIFDAVERLLDAR